MKDYDVFLELSISKVIRVKADSEEQAEDAVREMLSNDLPSVIQGADRNVEISVV